MKIIREICGACPQDIVIELDNGERYNFYLRWGNARLYDEHGTEVLITRQAGGEWDGVMPIQEIEPLIKDMVREWKHRACTHCPHCGGEL